MDPQLAKPKPSIGSSSSPWLAKSPGPGAGCCHTPNSIGVEAVPTSLQNHPGQQAKSQKLGKLQAHRVPETWEHADVFDEKRIVSVQCFNTIFTSRRKPSKANNVQRRGKRTLLKDI
uniref:Uncharacterized protein n=1 Tax=Sphaerodactylus townsendi TaxID=933632 RepID=A0ACB8FUU7_9SAUR